MSMQLPLQHTQGQLQLLDQETVNKLLDFSQKLDIGLLDQVVSTMYSGQDQQQKMAQEVLTTLKEHPDAWAKVDTILEFSTNQQTKYYALQILESVIKTRWKVLARNQCDGIKKYIVDLVIKTSSEQDSLEKERTYLNKLNMILVQILKCEWPKNWKSFISDIIGASKTNESLCQNNMVILKLLSEEVFDFSSSQMTQTKAKHLKDMMTSQFSDVFQLCHFVLDSSQNAPLVSATLETLLRFLNWIPLDYILEMNLIDMLVSKFLNVPMFRNVTLKCLTEIAAVTLPLYDDAFVMLFKQTMIALEEMMPVDTDIRQAYANGLDAEQQFIQDLALFLCTFLQVHATLIEKQNMNEVLLKALSYLLLISELDEVEIFKICLEYWNTLCADLFKETSSSEPSDLLVMSPPSQMSSDGKNTTLQRRCFYKPTLTKIREIMISKMAKPEEVLVIENEQGEVVREFMKDTDSINLYKNMRETLVYLTHLDCEDTMRIMTQKLLNQVNGTDWSWRNLNTVCWAIGSISGSMHEDDEKRLLLTVLQDLLGLCEQKEGKDNKAIIMSNIMYIVGQYPRFLRVHWQFLKTVVNKLFEFMHETHEGVQDMACDTFKKIALKCRSQFIRIQVGEVEPFINKFLTDINSIICDLHPQQVHTFYEAVGHMISASTDLQWQEQLIQMCMQLPNQVWDDIINQASKDVNVLKDADAVEQLGSTLKTNVHVCKALRHPFIFQLRRIYLDMLNVYKVMSENILTATSLSGEGATRQPLIKSMRIVKKETLKLISCWVERSNDPNMVLDNFIPLLLDAVLLDYQRCAVHTAREPEVLSTMIAVVNKLKSRITGEIPKIFDALIECTLDMIKKDFEEFSEHRTHFFLLLQAVNLYCFDAFLTIPPAQFKLILDSIIWAFKHTMRKVADTGLSILFQLLHSVSSQNEVAQSFYQTYYTDILQHLFSVVIDMSHTASLTLHANVLAYMLTLVETNKISVNLSTNAMTSAVASNNIGFVQEFITNMLRKAVPHLTDNQIKIFVIGFFNLNQDIPAFKEHLRDFLVQIREFTGEDDSDLFLEERELALKKAQDEKRKIHSQVPGMLNPHEVPEERQEM